MVQDDGSSPSQAAFVGLTVKNTFIDFQTLLPPTDPPTASAPANMGTAGGLSRLFRKREPVPAEDSLPELPASTPRESTPDLHLPGPGSPMRVLPKTPTTP